MDEIIGYKWEVYYDSTLIHEDDNVYEDEEEAIDEASEYVADKIKQWQLDGGWHEGDDSIDNFDIVIVDVI